MNLIIGAGAAGGIGEAIANHIIDGRPPFDMYNLVSMHPIDKYVNYIVGFRQLIKISIGHFKIAKMEKEIIKLISTI